jgi:hypothetical protein
MPLDVRLAGAQQVRFAVGTRPEAQQNFGGRRTIGLHWPLLRPLGICPVGQQVPVEVIWLVRQQVVPVEVYPSGQQFGSVEPGKHLRTGGGRLAHLPLMTMLGQQTWRLLEFV